jgi:DNA-binding NarL/FixJ family response regulator
VHPGFRKAVLGRVVISRPKPLDAARDDEDQTEAFLRRIRVLLADDYEPWRRCVSSLFVRHPEWQIVAEVSDGLEAVQKATELEPDLVLLDLNLPKLNGIEAANRIRTSTPHTKILFITAYRDSDAVETVLRNVAEGYILKWDITRDLVPAVEAVLCGGIFVSEHITDPPT